MDDDMFVVRVLADGMADEVKDIASAVLGLTITGDAERSARDKIMDDLDSIAVRLRTLGV